MWSGPNTSDNLPRGQGLQTGQTHPPQWNQSHPGFQPSQGIPLTQGTQQIPPGQVGNSQHYLGMSQQSGHTAQNQSWGPSHGTPVAPRPQVQGIGLGGMVPSFPPTPPTWTSSQFPGHPRLPQYGPGTPSSQRPTQVSPPSRSTSGTPLTPGKTQMGRIPNIPIGQYWKPDEEHYDIQKLNGLTLPRTIRASSWTQLKDIEGCDPLTVPLSKLLYQGSENYWLRKLATGREVYVATMGEVSQVVFVSEIYHNSEAVELILTNWHNTRLFKMVMPWKRKKPFKVWQNLWEISSKDGLLRFKLIPALITRLPSWRPG